MRVIIEKSTANGRLMAPPSKSMAHRLLICGALSPESIICGVEYSEDILATLDCLEQMGAHVEKQGNTVRLGGLTPASISETAVFCRESGSTLRFLIPLAMLSPSLVEFSGSERLFQRPLEVYKTVAQQQQIPFIQKHNKVCVGGSLKSGQFAVRGDVSSQFVSGLLFALSMLQESSSIRLTHGTESVSYIDLTCKACLDFGVEILQKSADEYFIPGGQSYQSRTLTVEGDYSNAAFAEALAVLGGKVCVEGLSENSVQGDRVYRTYFGKIGKQPLDIRDCPDLAPVLFALAAAGNGGEFTGTRRLQLKESDRARAMQSELIKFGIPVTVEDNRVIVHEAPLRTPDSVLDGHNDHRIVMALSVLCTLTGGTIEGAQAVSKSWPHFFTALTSLGIKVKTYET